MGDVSTRSQRYIDMSLPESLDIDGGVPFDEIYKKTSAK